MKQRGKQWLRTFKFQERSITQILFASLFILVILPLIAAGLILVNTIYRDDFKTNCRQYAARTRGTSEQLDSIFLDAENLALKLYLDKDAQRFLKEKNIDSSLYLAVSQMFREQTRLKNWYKSINISIGEDIFVQWNDGTIIRQDDVKCLEKAYELNYHGYWTLPHTIKNTVTPKRAYSGNVLTFYGKIFDFNYFKNILGILNVSISEEYLSDVYSSTLGDSGNLNMLINSDGNVMSSNDKSILGKECPDYEMIRERITERDGNFSIKLQNTSYEVFYHASEHFDWYLVSIVPRLNLTQNAETIGIILGAVGLCILFGFIFAIIQHKYVILPLNHLADVMHELPEGNTEYSLNFAGSNEINQLYHAFIQMNHDIDDMIQKNYVSEIYRKEAELQMLMSQINPHFLYNTLDSIYWLAVQNKDYNVAEQIMTLSNVFRHTLKTKEKYIKLSDEIDFIREYIGMMKVQASYDIEFACDIKGELMNLEIPRLLLQPVVENAFIHGIWAKEGDSCILITAEMFEDKLYISVCDDGIGADEAEVQRELSNPDKNNNAFALKNVDKRIKLIYGTEYGIEFHSKKAEGTTVIIVLPVESDAGT